MTSAAPTSPGIGAARDRSDDDTVLIDVVTVAAMRLAGINPQHWLSGLEPEVATAGGHRILIGLTPDQARRERALSDKATPRQSVDVLDVVDDDGRWRVAPSGHMKLSKGISWLARTTLPKQDGRQAGIADRGALSIQDHGLPETIVSALTGSDLGVILDLDGISGANIESVSTEAGYLEIVVDAPWIGFERPAWP